MIDETYDFIVIGSGFGGSVSALRLTEKGYSVLVLERGKRFRDQDFPKTNWIVWKYLWAPKLGCYGILQIVPFRDVIVLQGSGVGGGSLGYANVLMQPSDVLFENPAWKHLADWKAVLMPHYATARRMLGVAPNPCLWESDRVLNTISQELGSEHTFQPVDVGIFFGDGLSQGEDVPDPYFDGEGPSRTTCTHCGGCLVGCRYNAKNTLVKNYLYLAEKRGAQVQAEAQAYDVRPLPEGRADGARYEVKVRPATKLLPGSGRVVRARNVVFSAGTLGTLDLLLRCRDLTGSLPQLSARLGDNVRTNSEALLGAVSRGPSVDYSKGIAITSIFQPDGVTAVEPVRYPAGSSLMRYLSSPLVQAGGAIPQRILRTLAQILLHPIDFLRTHVLPGWAQRTTILLVMQTEDNRIRMGLGRHPFTLFRKGLVSISDADHRIPSSIESGHRVTRAFAQKTDAVPSGTLNEALLNIPMTAHILGGVPFGRDSEEGVIGLDCQVHQYPGLYVVDGSIVPANPGVNPSLTITALAEYAMTQVPPKDGI